jgi:hypothetical protein
LTSPTDLGSLNSKAKGERPGKKPAKGTQQQHSNENQVLNQNERYKIYK